MAYDPELEEKIDHATVRWKDLAKKKMFGGVCYLLKGNMCFGIYKDSLIVRMDKDEAVTRLRGRNVRPFDITGRPMSGWVMVDKAGWKKTADFAAWLGIGKKFALTLPEKEKKKRKKTPLRNSAF